MEVPQDSYCYFALQADANNVHRNYHDDEYGFQLTDDNELFARLVLEINQAGLSWTTILNKKENFYKAYHNFDIDTVASYKEKDRARLLNDEGIIRNKLKIDAAIYNANRILKIRDEYGSFYLWLLSFHPLTKDQWVQVFKQHFRFTGGEIVNEFLMSSGFLPGAHHEKCPVYNKVLLSDPHWLID